MREPLAGLDVEVTGERSRSNPKYFTSMSIVYRLRGGGLAREKVQRAVELSHSTYCSALASLRPDCKVTSSIEFLGG
jgi:putative redox protein